MRIPSWQTECALSRMNRGKKTPAEIHNEAERTTLRNLVAGLAAKWATEDQLDQTTRTDESRDIVNTDKKSKLFRLTYRELRHHHFGVVAKFPEALAKVVAKHPEFANIKAEVATEFTNEAASVPTPEQFQQEVLAAKMANGGDYGLAFRVTCQKYPAMQRQVAFQNEEMAEEQADSTKASKEFRDLLNTWFNNHPTLDRSRQEDYDHGYNSVAQAHPELMARMIQPGKGPINLWRKTSDDGHTPPRTPAPKKAVLKYGPGIPPNRMKEAQSAIS